MLLGAFYRSAIRLDSRLIVFLSKFALILLGVTWSQAGASQTTVLLCNGSGHELRVAETYDYNYEGSTYWKEHGSWIIERGQCQQTPTAIVVDRAIGYAFFADIDGEQKNLVFSLDDVFIRNRTLGSDFMCARTQGQFSYAPRTSSEVGRDCPAGAKELHFSFWHHESPRFSSKRRIERYHLSEFTVLDIGGKSTLESSSEIDIQVAATDPSFPKDEARALFVSACEGGNIDACVYAGNFFLYGEGGERDVAGARRLYEHGCEIGGAAPCTHAARLVQFGAGGSPDPERAQELYQLACDRKLLSACDFIE